MFAVTWIICSSMNDNYQYNTFKELYDEYFHQVYQFLKNKTKQEEDAKDLAQDVFLKAFQHFQKVNSANKIDSYLFTISRNVLVDYYKNSNTNQQLALELKNQLQAIETTNTTTSYKKIHQLHKSIEALPDQRKEILKRKKLHGQSTEEIAEELQLSKRTVENQIYRAMLTLRKQLTHFLSSLF